jgi:hypothetical protein
LSASALHRIPSVASNGHVGIAFAENTFWQTLFGLLFWDELFESGQLHTSFDWVPHCLNNRSFARQFTSWDWREAECRSIRERVQFAPARIAAKWGRCPLRPDHSSDRILIAGLDFQNGSLPLVHIAGVT